MSWRPGSKSRSTQQRLSGHIGSLQITQEFALLTAIVMAVLSRVLPYRANRWSNIIVGLLQTAFAATTLVGATFPELFSIFFVALEVASTVFIVWYAWTWPRPDGAMLTSA